MASQFEVDQIIEGKVTGIQPYGAFVALNKDTQGLVHISEITHGYVKDVNEHLTVGDEVKVKVLNVDEKNNKVSLSIRATEEAPKQTKAKRTRKRQSQPSQYQDEDFSEFNSLKGKLEKWIAHSEERESTFKK